MNKKLNIKLEKEYHNKVSEEFFQKRKKDYIWEVPESLVLLKNRYFQNKSVIDMGCGPSYSIKASLSKKVLISCKYTGVDISKKMLMYAKLNVPNGIFMQHDISNLNNKNVAFDTIISLGSLHHTLNPKRTLANWKNMLNKGGYILMREPLFEFLKRGHGASPLEEGIKIHEIESYLLHNDFKIVKKIFFGSRFFHLLNRVFIKFLNKIWIENKIFWYPVMIVDIGVSNSLGRWFNFFNGDSVLLIAQKI